ncbi:dihydroneopterin aldolase [Aquihabitans sp. McL0605]|uniref:dihydroneopterin aldolase n=1 Tax=Aquihabitans sp. McL0605 TaxID=3415671 RepID=UPI003CF8D2FA
MPEAGGGPGDLIELHGLEVVGICGALPEERDRAQPLEIDLLVEADLSVAGGTDVLADTIDYGALCDAAVAVVHGGAPQLLEHLAAQIADAVLAVDERAAAVTVAVRKLRPPVPHALATSGVRIRRVR